MAKESTTNYSVSKETALLLDAVKYLEKAYDCVSDSIEISYKPKNDDEHTHFIKPFSEKWCETKEAVIEMINENIKEAICLKDFKSI